MTDDLPEGHADTVAQPPAEPQPDTVRRPPARRKRRLRVRADTRRNAEPAYEPPVLTAPDRFRPRTEGGHGCPARARHPEIYRVTTARRTPDGIVEAQDREEITLLVAGAVDENGEPFLENEEIFQVDPATGFLIWGDCVIGVEKWTHYVERMERAKRRAEEELAKIGLPRAFYGQRGTRIQHEGVLTTEVAGPGPRAAAPGPTGPAQNANEER